MENETNEEKSSAEADNESNLHFVTTKNELSVGERILTTIDGIEVAVFRTKKGLFAVSNFCPHQGGPLCEGLCSGTVTVDEQFELQYTEDSDIIFCPWHGWEFDIETGEHLSQTGHQVPTFETVVDDNNVYVEL